LICFVSSHTFKTFRINKPGGHGKIVQIHYSSLGVVDGLDVKYTLCNRTDTHLEAGLVTPHVELDRGGRSRRERAIMNIGQQTGVKNLAVPPAGEGESEEKENKGFEAISENSKAAKKEKKRQLGRTVPHQKQPTVHGKSKTFKKPKAATNPTSSKARKCTSENSSLSKSFAGEKASIPRLVITNTATSNIVVSPLPDGNGNSKSYHLMWEDEADTNDVSGHPLVAVAAGTNEEQQRTLKRSFENNMQEASKYVEMIVGKPTTSTAEKPAVPPRAEKSQSQLLEEEYVIRFCYVCG
jgi:hypothetical protein